MERGGGGERGLRVARLSPPGQYISFLEKPSICPGFPTFPPSPSCYHCVRSPTSLLPHHKVSLLSQQSYPLFNLSVSPQGVRLYTPLSLHTHTLTHVCVHTRGSSSCLFPTVSLNVPTFGLEAAVIFSSDSLFVVLPGEQKCQDPTSSETHAHTPSWRRT